MEKQIAITTTVIFLAAASFVMPRTAMAQTTKVAERKNMQGQIVRTPYIALDELQSSFIEEKAVSGKTVGSNAKESLSSKTFREILEISSIDEAVRLLGEPRTIERDEFSDGEWAATLRYGEGTFFDYRKYEDGTISLLEFQLCGTDWSLKVGGTRLRTGMSTDSLSQAVRQSISKGSYPEGTGVDGIGVIHIAKPSTAEGGQVELIQEGKAQITVHVNRKSRVLEVVRFVRLGPW